MSVGVTAKKMTQSPVSPLVPNVEFVEHYIDSMENLPLDVQRFVSQLREYDILYRTKLDQIGHFLSMYRKEDTGLGKRKFLSKIQKCLIRSQQVGDEKLNLISQIMDLVEARTQLVTRDAEFVDLDAKEEVRSGSNGHRIKLEKPQKSLLNDKAAKNIYEKPKRIRRVRALEKPQEKGEKNTTTPRYIAKEENGEEDDEIEMEEEEEEVEVRQRKDPKKKQEKAREKEKDKPKEEKEEKKIEKNNKSGKISKKSNSKHGSSKVKKKKKKEKETTLDDLPVDPDEPTYCVCNSISYGDMIGCDNDDCQIEWFHFGCVNLTHKPKGKWYCPSCAIERRERNKK